MILDTWACEEQKSSPGEPAQCLLPAMPPPPFVSVCLSSFPSVSEPLGILPPSFLYHGVDDWSRPGLWAAVHLLTGMLSYLGLRRALTGENYKRHLQAVSLQRLRTTQQVGVVVRFLALWRMSVRNHFQRGKAASCSCLQRSQGIAGWRPYFWNTGEAEHDGGRCESRTSLFTVARKQGE